MKKIVSLVLAFLMLFAVSSGAFAAEIKKTPASYDFAGKIELSVDLTGVDIDSVTEAALKAPKLSYHGSVIQKDDLSVQLYFDSEFFAQPLYMPIKLWMDLDLKASDELVYKIIFEIPEFMRAMARDNGLPEMDVQYLLIDYGKLFAMPDTAPFWDNTYGSLLSDIENSPLKEWSENLTAELCAGIPVQTIGENHYKIALNDGEITELVIKFTDALMDLFASPVFLDQMLDMFTSLAGEDEGSAIEEWEDFAEVIYGVKAELPKVYSILRNVEIFPGDGYVYEYKENAEGYVTYEKTNINFKLDVDEWVSAIIAVYPEVGYYGEPEETGIVVSATFLFEAGYGNINAVQSIAFPALNAGNCFDFAAYLGDMYEDYPDYPDYGTVDNGGLVIYVVARGDYLWQIAQKQYGDGNRWTEIYELNKDAIGSDPSFLRVGQELWIKAA